MYVCKPGTWEVYMYVNMVPEKYIYMNKVPEKFIFISTSYLRSIWTRYLRSISVYEPGTWEVFLYMNQVPEKYVLIEPGSWEVYLYMNQIHEKYICTWTRYLRSISEVEVTRWRRGFDSRFSKRRDKQTKL